MKPFEVSSIHGRLSSHDIEIGWRDCCCCSCMVGLQSFRETRFTDSEESRPNWLGKKKRRKSTMLILRFVESTTLGLNNVLMKERLNVKPRSTTDRLPSTDHASGTVYRGFNSRPYHCQLLSLRIDSRLILFVSFAIRNGRLTK